jgi:sulfite exporter TauE/SafE
MMGHGAAGALAGYGGSWGGLAIGGLWAAFALGLTGGFGHCLAMCGPLVAAASLARGCAGGSRGVGGTVGFQAAYHGGRLVTYALLGAILGVLGQAGALGALASPIQLGAPTQWLKLVAGAFMIGVGALMLGAAATGRTAQLPEPTAPIARSEWFGRASRALIGGGNGRGFGLGMLMGLLPCMPLLPVEIAALATAQPLAGALTMLVFGFGTLPALVGAGALAETLGERGRTRLATATAAIVIVLGVIVAWQGMALALAPGA